MISASQGKLICLQKINDGHLEFKSLFKISASPLSTSKIRTHFILITNKETKGKVPFCPHFKDEVIKA